MKRVVQKCHARVGLMGNPSDGFCGKTISFLIDNFYAEVTVVENIESARIVLQETLTFVDSNNLCGHSMNVGYSSGMKLLQATCKVFFRICTDNGLNSFSQHGFTMSYNTNIPRMVGLSGSSAIIVAAFNALMQFYEVNLASLGIAEQEYPSIILSVEKDELGIAAGLQDRVIQCYGGLVYMDFSNPPNHKYVRMSTSVLPQMYLAYNINAGGDSGKVHSTVKERWNSGDLEVIEGMQALASYAEEARRCLLERNFVQLAVLMKSNFAMRRQLYGDGVVGAKNIEIVTLADQLGLSAKFSGSGGAVLCLRSDGLGWYDETEEKIIREMFWKQGYEFVRLKLCEDS